MKINYGFAVRSAITSAISVQLIARKPGHLDNVDVFILAVGVGAAVLFGLTFIADVIIKSSKK